MSLAFVLPKSHSHGLLLLVFSFQMEPDNAVLFSSRLKPGQADECGTKPRKELVLHPGTGSLL